MSTPPPPQINPYGQPQTNVLHKSANEKSQTVLWYRVYCFFMALMYLAVAGFGVFFFFLLQSDEVRNDEDRVTLILTGAMLLIMGLAFALVYLVGLIWTRGNGAWILGLVLIVIGLTSCLTLPAALPLMIFWLKPEVKSKIIGTG